MADTEATVSEPELGTSVWHPLVPTGPVTLIEIDNVTHSAGCGATSIFQVGSMRFDKTSFLQRVSREVEYTIPPTFNWTAVVISDQQLECLSFHPAHRHSDCGPAAGASGHCQ